MQQVKTCGDSDCDRSAKVRGLCQMHYKRKLKSGEFELTCRPYEPNATCSVEGCDQRPRSRGMCASHRRKVELYGSVESPPKGPWQPRFWDKVYPEPMSGCWLWGASVDKWGYGKFALNPGELHGAHRVAYELIKGPIPDGLVLDHLCRVRCCVNPDHLEPVTVQVNNERGMAPNFVAWRQDTCTKGHEWTAENTYSNGGRRTCRTCRRDRQRM